MGFGGGGWGGGSGGTGGGGSSDTIPPVLADFNPPLGTPIPRMGAVQFTVTDETALRRVIIVAAYPESTGIDELVHDGNDFRGAYASRGRRESVPGGFRFTVARGAGGFPSSPKFRVFAVDKSGNENL